MCRVYTLLTQLINVWGRRDEAIEKNVSRCTLLFNFQIIIILKNFAVNLVLKNTADDTCEFLFKKMVVLEGCRILY